MFPFLPPGRFVPAALVAAGKGQRVPVVSNPLLLSALCRLVWIANASSKVYTLDVPGYLPGYALYYLVWYQGICPGMTNITRFGTRA